MANVLVTGGAGFIGSFMVDELVKRGHKVKIFDNLVEQVHNGKIPKYLNKKAEFIHGDVCDKKSLKNALKNIDFVFHEAAEVGVGQSMYKISRYVSANTLGTANLLDIIVNNKKIKNRLEKLIVAASMSSYGEGAYRCVKCETVNPPLRSEEQLKNKDWELHCPKCKIRILDALATNETKIQEANSIYAITKKDQEEMVMTIGKAYEIPTVALRYFNGYGPRQSLNNPYTGVAAIFMSRLKNNQHPLIFEDGNQRRDFVSVYDIVQANMLAMEKKEANYNSFNVGSGQKITIKQVAETISKLYNKEIEPKITNQYRKGDIRHCFADISKIEKTLGYKPKINFNDGMAELIEWSNHEKSMDLVNHMANELKKRKIIV